MNDPANAPDLPRMPVVLTIGKVGSKTYAYSIRGAGLPCIQIHSLRRDGLLQASLDAIDRSVNGLPHACLALGWLDTILQRKHRFAFITGVRDPIEIAISSYFENVVSAFTIPIQMDLTTADHIAETIVPNLGHAAASTEEWFESEFNGTLDLDILGQNLSPDLRTWVLERPFGIRALIVRIDAPDEVKAAALSSFLGHNIKLVIRNKTESKPYAQLYRAVLKRIIIPEKILLETYNSRFSRCFWGDDERYAMRMRWSRIAGRGP
jgi:hypothetical protein